MQEENIYEGKEMHESFKNMTKSMGDYRPDTAPRAFQINMVWMEKRKKEEKTKRQLHFKATVVLKLKTTRVVRDILLCSGYFLSRKMLRRVNNPESKGR